MPGQRHLVHTPVTSLAAFTLIHVNAYIEIGEIRQIVYTRPGDRSVGAKTFPYRLKGRAGVPDLRVAVHAGLRRRNIREGRFLHRCVAVTAVQPHVAHMMGVAEGHWLVACDAS